MKTEFTREDIHNVYNEMKRRIEHIKYGLNTEDEIIEYKKAMLQGTYSTLMVLSSNWADVLSWMFDEEFDFIF